MRWSETVALFSGAYPGCSRLTCAFHDLLTIAETLPAESIVETEAKRYRLRAEAM